MLPLGKLLGIASVGIIPAGIIILNQSPAKTNISGHSSTQVIAPSSKNSEKVKLNNLDDYQKYCQVLMTLTKDEDEINRHVFICKVFEDNSSKNMEVYLYKDQKTPLKKIKSLNYRATDTTITFKYQNSQNTLSQETMKISQYSKWDSLNEVNLSEKCFVNWSDDYKKMSCNDVESNWTFSSVKESLGLSR